MCHEQTPRGAAALSSAHEVVLLSLSFQLVINTRVTLSYTIETGKKYTYGVVLLITRI